MWLESDKHYGLERTDVVFMTILSNIFEVKSNIGNRILLLTLRRSVQYHHDHEQAWPQDFIRHLIDFPGQDGGEDARSPGPMRAKVGIAVLLSTNTKQISSINSIWNKCQSIWNKSVGTEQTPSTVLRPGITKPSTNHTKQREKVNGFHAGFTIT